jgi:flagellar hook-associated protein 2
VTLNLSKEGSATVTVATSTNSITSAINSFVSDYNSLITGLNGQFKYDAGSGSSGLLATNAATRSLQADLLNAVTYSTSDANAGSIKTLSALGISMNDDGTLTVDSTKLQDALKNNPSQVQSFFQGSASNGFANKLANTLDMYTDTSNGAFTVDIKNNKQQIDDLQGQIKEREAYVSEQMPIWQTKYAKAASELLSLPSKLKQIDAMLGNDKND